MCVKVFLLGHWASSKFNKLVWPPVHRSHPLNAIEKKGKVDKQSDGKSQAR